MKLVSTAYSRTAEFTDPAKWLERISFYTRLLEELALQHQVHSIERISYEGELEQNGVSYHFIRLKNEVVRFPRRMHGLIKKIKPDVVLVNGFIFPLQVMQLRWKLGKAVKIFILHRAEKPSTGLKRQLQRMASKQVDAFLFTSNEFGNHWKGIIPENKIHEVIQSSSSFIPKDKEKAKSSLGMNSSPVFLWVGRLDANKDPLTLIRGFKKYLEIDPRAKLYIIYQSDELINECRELSGVSDGIQLIGKVDHKTLECWYNAADFFISTSHAEGSGIAASEAMSCGCIPVLSDIISFRRMTGPGHCGVLFKPGSAEELFNALVNTRNLDKENEKQKVLHQFNTELSFEAISRKIDVIIGSLK